MYTLYNAEKDEYIGVEHGCDECNMPFQSLVEYSTLDDDQPFLLVVKDRKVLDYFIRIANEHYNGNVPIGAAMVDYDCDVPDIGSYQVVALRHVE